MSAGRYRAQGRAERADPAEIEEIGERAAIYE